MVKLKALGKRDQKLFRDTTLRKCTDACFFFKNGGSGCQYFESKECKTGDACMYDLVKIKVYADAFQTGETAAIKTDASRITAMVMMQVENMMQQVSVEGLTVNEPVFDAKGAVVYIPDPDWSPRSGLERQMVPCMKMKEHPLISRAIQLAKSIGVNLAEFKLTPKSADEKASVAGHIIVEHQLDMKTIQEKRDKTEERFVRAVELGNEMTKEDPVFNQLLEQGDIISG